MSESGGGNKGWRFIIYGAGAVGGVIGGHLALAGKEVIMIENNPDHVNAIREQGLKLIKPNGTRILHVAAVTAPNQIDFQAHDVVWSCVKGQHTDEALRNLHAVVEDIPIFVCQNGVRNEEIAAKYFRRVYGVEVGLGGVRMNYGEVVCRTDPPGSLVIGRYPKGTDDLVEAIARELRSAEIRVKVTSDVMPYKWGKLMYNLGNAVNGITNIRLGDNIPTLEAVRQEAQSICSQAGIHIISREELALEWPESTLPPRARMETTELSSTWQSLTRHEGSVETDFLNGEIVRVAKRLGRQAPLNEALCRIAQEMATKHELPGKYTPTQLSALLGLTSKTK